ncbi:MAG: hypothetical protein RL026_2121 [Pseudomonadota bacterium]
MAAAAALAGAGSLHAAEPAARKAITAVRVATPAVIDGRLDEAWWADAALIDDMAQIRPGDGAPGSERTEVLVAYDADNLYIGARMYDSGGKAAIAANILRQNERLMADDRIAVILDPFNSGRAGYRFETNLNGVRNDQLYTGISSFNSDWSVIWDTKAVLTDYGWSLEMAIPFKSLPIDPDAETWGFNVSRAIRRRGEEITWVSRNRSWNPSIVGELRGIDDVDQGKGLDVVPSLLVGHGKLAGGKGEFRLEPSLDVYYRLTPSLNASLTLNTDFSAAEVDDRQVNLTRFGLFFPEKRDFFLNDADLFEFGRIGFGSYLQDTQSATRASFESGRPFFSRRIGLSGSGAPVDLLAGGKLSGRVGRWRVGALAVHQDGYVTPEGLQIDPATLGVVRAAADVFGESSVGVVATTGNPGSNLGASLVGFDFLYLDTQLAGGRTLEGEAWFQQSQRAAAEGGTDQAWGVGLRLPNADGLRFGVGVKQIGEDFQPALGFVSRRGVREYTANVGATWNRSGSLLRSIYTGIDGWRAQGLNGGGLQSQAVTWKPLWIETHQRDKLLVYASHNEEMLAQPFTLYQDTRQSVVLHAGRYDFRDVGLELETGPQRSVSGILTYRQGSFYDGRRRSLGGSVTWRPSRHFGGTFGYDQNHINLPAGGFRTHIARLLAEVAFNSQWSWVSLVQYDTVSEVLGMQTRLLWIPRAGQEFFMVANHSLQDIDKDGRFVAASTDVSAKVGYTLRF